MPGQDHHTAPGRTVSDDTASGRTVPGHPPPYDTTPWLTAHGWYPGRDTGNTLAPHIARRVRDFHDQGEELTPTHTAVTFLRTYGGLRLPLSDRVHLVTEPDGGHVEIAEDVADLAAHLGQRLFPVAYETDEGSVHLVDETDRFFLLHPSGTSYLGTGAREAFTNRRRHTLVDAWSLHAHRPGHCDSRAGHCDSQPGAL